MVTEKYECLHSERVRELTLRSIAKIAGLWLPDSDWARK